MQIAISRAFVESLANLGYGNARMTVSFVRDAVQDPAFGVGESEAELCGDGHASVHALRVGEGLRAIGSITADMLLLLFVGAYDDAYDWARQNCRDHPPSPGIKISADSLPGKPVLGLPSSRIEGQWHCVLTSPRDLDLALRSSGVVY